MTTIETTERNYDEQFNKASHEFTAHWNMGREAARNAGIKINDMVSITHQQYPDWSINKIAQRIYIKHEELDGFSKRTIYNNLNEENRQLVESKYDPTRNNVLEEKVATLQPNVTEESSISEPQMSEEEADEILKELPEPADEIICLDEEKELQKDFQEWKAERAIRREIEQQLPIEVVEHTKSIGLPTNKLKLLTHKRLKKEHPNLLKSIIEKIEDKSDRAAHDKIVQEVNDLETGYLIRSGDTYYYGDPDKRDLIKGNKREAKHPEMAYLDIIGSIHKLCEDLTGHKLERNEFKYTLDHFKYTKEYRQEIVRNNNDKRSLIALNNQLVLIADYADDFVKMIDEALDDIDRKPNLNE